MITDDLAFADRYRGLGPDFSLVLDLLRSPEAAWAAGKTDLRPGDVWLTVTQKAGRPAFNAGFEYHRLFADVHLCLQGAERMGWRESHSGLEVRTAFDESRDFGLLEGTPTQFVTLTPGRFAIFFPGELHAPFIGDGELTKVCVKIRVPLSA